MTSGPDVVRRNTFRHSRPDDAEIEPYDLAIVVVTYNSADVIGAMLDSLPAGLGELRADVVVVDNGSQDATVDIARGRPGVRVVQAVNRGYAAGINQGLAVTRSARAVLVLNPDVRLHKGSAAPLMAALRLPGTGIVAPQVRSVDGSLHYSLRREPTLRRAVGLNVTRLAMFAEFVNRPAAYERPQVVDWALGAALLLSRECLDACADWDESFFLYSEETDYCLRARDLGFSTRYEPRSELTHIGGASGRTNATHVMQIVNRVRLYRRRHPVPAAWVYFGLTVLSETSWLLRGHRQSWYSVRALLQPGRRPAELGCTTSMMPR